MIVEWFVGFILDVVDFLLSWLPEADPLTLPDLSPAFGLLRSLDAATAGVLSETFEVVLVLLGVFLVLFMFGVIRQVWRFVPIIGGG